MENVREEVVELFEGNEVDPLIDGEGFYTATEQNLFSDDDALLFYVLIYQFKI